MLPVQCSLFELIKSFCIFRFRENMFDFIAFEHESVNVCICLLIEFQLALGIKIISEWHNLSRKMKFFSGCGS